MALRSEIAEQLAVLDDPREIEALLAEQHRKALAQMAAELKKQIAGEVETAA